MKNRDVVVGTDSNGNKVRCSSCPNNVFGSKGKGKLCSEQRIIQGRTAEISFESTGHHRVYDLVSGSLIELHLPSTSIPAVRGIQNACVSRGIHTRFSVFMLSVENRTDGENDWGVLSASFMGYISEYSIGEVNQVHRDISLNSQGDQSE